MRVKLFQVLGRSSNGLLTNAAPGFAVATSRPDRGRQAIAFGTTGNADGERVSVHTPYDLASVTKLYTTASTLRLAELGRLSLDQECGEFLSALADSDIRISDLLTHRVRFQSTVSELRQAHGDNFGRDLLAKPMASSRTESPQYSNLAYIYLGMIIEGLLGLPLASVFQELFVSLGLKETFTGNLAPRSAPPTEWRVNGFVRGVTHDESAALLGGVAGNAGVFASVSDLLEFGMAWAEDRIVTSQTLRDSIFVPLDIDGTQALGWRRILLPSRELLPSGVFAHSGFTGCLLAVNPSSKSVAAIVCNRTLLGRGNMEHLRLWNLVLGDM